MRKNFLGRGTSALLSLFVLASTAWAKPPTQPIIDGTRVSENDYPFVVRILLSNQTQCTGSLIAPNFILTAAHCVFNNKNQVIPGNSFVMRMAGQQIRSKTITVHPTYSPRSGACEEGEIDAAVIELESAPIGISPVVMIDGTAPIGTQLTLVGYGTEGTGATGENGNLPPDGLVNVGYTNIEGSGETPSIKNPNSIYENWIFNPGEQNTASGDSGGPAFLQIGTDLYLSSITCGGTNPSSFNTYSVNTKVSSFKAWALGITGQAPANSAPTILNSKVIATTLNAATSQAISVSGTQPIAITVTGLPDGLTFDGTNIVGTPTVAGSFNLTVTATNSAGTATKELKLVVSGFSSGHSVKRALLQFDYDGGISDFLDIDGQINVGKNFNPKNQVITARIGRFSKEFKLRGNGTSAGKGKSFFDLDGAFKGKVFKNAKVKFFLTLERVAIFDELATLGFPDSATASAGQQVPLPLSITLNGVETTTTVILTFTARDARWRIVK